MPPSRSTALQAAASPLEMRVPPRNAADPGFAFSRSSAPRTLALRGGGELAQRALGTQVAQERPQLATGCPRGQRHVCDVGEEHDPDRLVRLDGRVGGRS